MVCGVYRLVVKFFFADRRTESKKSSEGHILHYQVKYDNLNFELAPQARDRTPN